MNAIPKGFKELENVESVYISENQIVILGIPDEDDETHDCDALGCSSVSHVIYRFNI